MWMNLYVLRREKELEMRVCVSEREEKHIVHKGPKRKIKCEHMYTYNVEYYFSPPGMYTWKYQSITLSAKEVITTKSQLCKSHSTITLYLIYFTINIMKKPTIHPLLHRKEIGLQQVNYLLLHNCKS